MSERSPMLETEDPTDPYRFQPSAPSAPGMLGAIRRHPFLFVLPAIVLAVVAFLVAAQRQPTYTARVRVNVTIDLSQPGAINGYASGAQALATAYSRAVAAQEVIQRVARAMKMTPLAVRSRVGATPIAGSPLFLIESIGTTPQQAIRLANLASTALVAYVKRTNAEAAPATGKLLKSYETLEAETVRASQEAAQARQLAAAQNTAAHRAEVARAEAAFAAARLRAESVSAAYTRIVTSQSLSNSVHVLAPATFAASDRRSKLQIYVFIAVVLGLVLGAALATLVTDREVRRSAAYRNH